MVSIPEKEHECEVGYIRASWLDQNIVTGCEVGFLLCTQRMAAVVRLSHPSAYQGGGNHLLGYFLRLYCNVYLVFHVKFFHSKIQPRCATRDLYSQFVICKGLPEVGVIISLNSQYNIIRKSLSGKQKCCQQKKRRDIRLIGSFLLA